MIDLLFINVLTNMDKRSFNLYFLLFFPYKYEGNRTITTPEPPAAPTALVMFPLPPPPPPRPFVPAVGLIFAPVKYPPLPPPPFPPVGRFAPIAVPAEAPPPPPPA
jgi:hypothetical protein